MPTNATSGQISVTVGGVTVTSTGSETVVPVPAILSVSPKSALAGTTVANFTVIGSNLAGASFAFGPQSIAIGAVSVNPAGTSATMSLSIPASAMGYFTFVATNANGSSNQLPIVGFLPGMPAFNTISIPGSNPSADADSDGLTNAQEIALGTDPLNPDTDGDGFYDGLEVLLGTNPLDPKSYPSITQAEPGAVSSATFSIQNNISPLSLVGPTLREADGLTFSIQNSLSPLSLFGPTLREADSLAFSLSNGTMSTISDSTSTVRRFNGSTGAGRSPARNTSPPAVSISYPRDGSRLLAGQTITVQADAASDALPEQVTISVNGVPFATGNTAPYQLTFTVPAGVSSVSFGASAIDSAGHVGSSSEVTILVTPDPMTTVFG